jgi:hypothetical protein
MSIRSLSVLVLAANAMPRSRRLEYVASPTAGGARTGSPALTESCWARASETEAGADSHAAAFAHGQLGAVEG